MRAAWGIAVAVPALVAACSTGPESNDSAHRGTTPQAGATAPSTPSSIGPSHAGGSSPSRPGADRVGRAGPRLDTWDIGARALPARPDGFGQVRRTPRELRVRTMPTITRLPDPPSDRFRGRITRITPWVRERMGTSWEPGCPVGLRDLRYLQVRFWGFDRRTHTGELVVHADHARGLVGVFRKLHAARFPIEQLTLPTSARRDPTPSGDGNGTGALVCRSATGQTSWSAHALGLAIDINPFQNPYVNDGLVIPELASAYRDRSWRRPGMIHPGGVVVRAFRDIGWSWGGAWRTLKDYQHFSATGR